MTLILRSAYITLVLAAWLPGSSALAADFGVSRGSACEEVSDLIRDNWFHLKAMMLPEGVNIARPRTKDLFCVSPYYTRDAMQRPVGARNLSCYKIDMDSPLFCCDQGKSQCAQVHPEAITRQLERQARQAEKREQKAEKKRQKAVEKAAKKAARAASKEG
jgi:hypothetical protein